MPAFEDVLTYPPKRAINLKNRSCAYCGRAFDAGCAATREHVIGRRFVPKGCFDGQWNLIVNACEPCNREKADLEDDISVISMLPDLAGRYPVDDPRLVSEVERKAGKAMSRKTGKAVARSKEEKHFEFPIVGGTLTYDVEAPAQIDEDRLFRLAQFHFAGFFHLITYNEAARCGRYMTGAFAPLIATRRADWGNPQMRWFMDLVRDWDLRIHALGADGFFKMLIRRPHDGRGVFAWALEWNQSFRVLGFAGDRDAIETLGRTVPALVADMQLGGGERWVRVRADTPLLDAEDDLFAKPEVLSEVPV